MASARYRGRMIVNDTDYTGSFVDPNPEGVATDDLNTVAIDGHIFNIAGSGGYQAYGFSPIIYSEEEREVGVWTDNKPLYQKTFILNQTVSNYQWTENILGTSGSGIEIKKYDGYLGINNEGYPTLPIDWCRSSTSYSTTNTSSNSDDLSIRPNIDGVNSVQVIYVTIQYTKTTDVAGSGEYNTLGIPNVHYDGNEKIIGTYFGETLYEKTLKSNSGIAQNSWVSIINDSSIRIKNYYGYIYYTPNLEDGTKYPLDWTRVANSAFSCTECNGGDLEVVQNVGTSYGYDVTIQYTKTSN